MTGSQDFYLSQLNVVVDSALATMDGADTSPLSGDATASVTISQSDAQSLLQFSSDSIDVANADATDILYRVIHNTSATPLGLDIDTSAEVIQNEVDSGAANNNLTYDFVRHLAVHLFNTHKGVDLFSNESELRSTLNSNFKTEFNQVLLDLAGQNNTDATGNSPAKSVLGQIIKNAPDRLQDITTYFIESIGEANWYKMPILAGDIIYFTLQVDPANNQKDLTGVSDVPSRKYLIKATIV